MSDIFGIQERIANRPPPAPTPDPPKPSRPKKPAPPAAVVTPPAAPAAADSNVVTPTDFTAEINDAYAGRDRFYGVGRDALGVPEPVSRVERVTEVEDEGSTRDGLQDEFLSYIQGIEQQRAQNEADMAARETERLKNDARQIVRNALESYRLPATLGTFIYDLITQDQIDLNNPDSILYAMRERPEYQERFKANAQRIKNGLPELDPGTYLSLENDFKQVMRANGLPPGFYDDNDDLAALIAGDTSPSEVQRRIEDGYNAVQLADPEVKRQMYNLYGVDDSQLVAYFLDPTRGETVLRRQTRSAQISAESKNLANIQLTSTLAQQLADAGVTQKEAQKGFGEISAMGELTQTFSGETALSSEQLVGAKFGTDTDAQKELARKVKMRTGEFAGGGSFARTTGETSGSISTAVGRAQ
jgi:hypothetical protein